MSVPAARRIIVGVDGSAESAAALRWACREASLRGAEVHAVHAREATCHGLASYAVPPPPGCADEDAAELWRSVLSGCQTAGVQVRTEVIDGLAARVLLDQCAGADMLVLGTASDAPGRLRSAGPVIRACLRRSPCPVVVISVAQDPVPRCEPPAVRSGDLPLGDPAIGEPDLGRRAAGEPSADEAPAEETPVAVGLRDGARVPFGAPVPAGV